MKKNYLFLLLIIILFLMTRLYRITEIPTSVYWDEASIGYNAYSILKTGKDEWGQFLPLHFKAFGEYKLPVYIYSVTFTEVIFGLNAFSVRLPSVLYSLGAVCLIYLISLKIFNNQNLSLFAAFFMTISPWFYIFSRTGYEATAGLFFYMLGVLLCIKFKEKHFFLIYVVLSFVLSIYSYNSFRILVPITLLVFIIYWLKALKQKKWTVILIVLLFIASILPIFQIYVQNNGGARLQAVGIMNQAGKIETLKTFFSNYASHFSPSFLLFNGDINLRSQQKNFGEIYLVDVLFLFLGIIYIFKKKSFNLFIPLGILIFGLIPASLTKESPHALRSISAVPALCIISAVGVYSLSRKFKNLSIFFILIISIYLILFFNYFLSFLKFYNLESFDDWQYNYKAIFQNFKNEQVLGFANKFNNFDHIIISDRYGQPYIFTLFYKKYDPYKFQKEVKYNQSIRKETSLVKSFDEFIFTNIDFYNIPVGKNLIFTHPSEKLTEIKEKNMILNPDGSVAFYVYEYEKIP